MAFTHSKLAEITVGAGNAASISFTNIPQNYNDLIVRFSTRATDAFDYGYITLNNSETNFTGVRIFADTSSSVVGYQARTDGYIYPSINGSNTTASTFGLLDLYISDYTSNKSKTISSEGFFENNGANGMVIANLTWANPSSITTVSFFPPSSSNRFAQHTTAYLYGVKAEV